MWGWGGGAHTLEVALTLRQDIVETAAREARVHGWRPDAAGLASWLAKSRVAGACAARHAMTQAEMNDAVDGMDFARLVAAVQRAAT